MFELNKSDLSKSWKILRSIIGKDSSNKRNTSFYINNVTVSDSEDIANAFNDFFVSIGPKLANSITSTINPLSYIDYSLCSIVTMNITEIQVKTIILSLKNSIPGWDEIPAYLGKQCIDTFIRPLTCIINKSLHDGVFPSELKLARLVPIFKGGDSSNIGNYRPISVLSFFSKIFEKVM